jgi:hypothetical protein
MLDCVDCTVIDLIIVVIIETLIFISCELIIVI